MHRLIEAHQKSNDTNDKEGESNKEKTDVAQQEGNKRSIVRTKEKVDGHVPFDVLPFDILKLIADRLPLVDCMNFRAVNQLCRSIPLSIHSSSPCLIFPYKHEGVSSLVDPKLGVRYLIVAPQMLKDSTICYSKHRWLLMCERRNIALFNPFTKSIVKLPDLRPLGTEILSFGFSSLPDSSDFVVVGIFSVRSESTFYIICNGETEWCSVDVDNNMEFPSNGSPPVFLDGAFYFLGENGHLGVLRLEDEVIDWEVLTRLKPLSEVFNQNFLVESDGKLLSVFVGQTGKTVAVFELNQSKFVWEEVRSLGNRMIFVSRASSFSSVATVPRMENKIYFPRFHGERIIFYSLDTGKYHTFGSDDSLMTYCDTREHLPSCWIEPNWT